METITDDKGHDMKMTPLERAPLERPYPRRPRTDAKLVRLGVRNRRIEYLLKTPSYFDNLDHELADPVLYERLVKRFQSPAEREAEENAKGYARTLEAHLIRGEAKVSNAYQASEQGSRAQEYANVPGSGSAGTNDWDADAENKEHGMKLWHAYIETRFVDGLDEEFDYEKVDDNYKYDTLAIRDAEDAWFDNEEPSWTNGDPQGRARPGETGIQDF